MPAPPPVSKSPLPVDGFRAAGIRCGIKARARDLALIASDRPAAVAGVFTRSSVVGAPVEWCRRVVRDGRARGVVVNSGIANVGMGARGRRDNEAVARAAARAVGCAPGEMLVASTGVIGEPLPMAKLRGGMPRAADALSSRGWKAAAEAIRTTDTYAKLACVETRIDGRDVRLVGIAKGSGMIEPNMATMLAFIATDAPVAAAWLRRELRGVADETFNRVSVDGETSTSDMLVCLANGAAGGRALRSARSAGGRRFVDALGAVCESLARDLARDGEGATKLVTVRVAGARNAAEAERAARRIANSMLVKTAVFGGDPNWGRILQTVGAGQVAIRLPRAQVRLGGVAVFRNGASAGPAARRRAARALAANEVEIEVALGAGRARAHMWTCDLSYDYVRINAEYTT